jgi:hypothetical protein
LNNIVLINYIDLVSQALLNYLNSEEIPVNTKGKYSILLSPQNKKKIMYFMESMLKNNIFYGKQTLIIQTCDVQKN